MQAHANLLAAAGHEVTVVAASGESRDPRIKMVLLPELDQGHPLAVEAEAELATVRRQGGGFPPGGPFKRLVRAMRQALTPWVEEADRVIVHNLFSMPFHLAATVALWEWADLLPKGRLIAWVHDLAALNPAYPAAHPGAPWPWALLSQRHPAVRVVGISRTRAREFSTLTGSEVEAVIPNAIDPLTFLNLTPAVEALARQHRWLEADLLLLHPVRLVRRKRVELGLQLVAALRDHWGVKARLLVTGAPDEHHPDSGRYLSELLALRERLGLSEEEVIFLHQHGPVGKHDLISLYTLSDVLFFPSDQEGFGLPLLEGALHRLLLFCVDREPMNTLALPSLRFFDSAAEPRQIARQLLDALDQEGDDLRAARREVVRRFSWESVWPNLQMLFKEPVRPFPASAPLPVSLP